MSFFVVRSSAGSGKTYTLVEQYLRMALKSEDPTYFRHILAITFTNKATNEMKTRILEALLGIAKSNSKYERLVNDLSDALEIEVKVLVNRSATVYNTIVHNYADFAV